MPALAACGESIKTESVPVTFRLPAPEGARYRLVDSKGEQIGTATLRTSAEGGGVLLQVAYDFGSNRTDTSAVLVQPETLRPTRSERTVVDGDQRYVTRSEYSDTDVTTTVDDGKRTRSRTAKLSDAAYDNLESLFLWRSADLRPGYDVRYVNVIVDAKRGTISRAVGQMNVVGREDLRLPGGERVPAWKVEFRSAGVTNTAWYRDDATRQLLRYEITRGPTLLLDTSGQ